MKLLEITTSLKSSEKVIGMPALVWLERERDRINKDPKRHSDPKRHTRIISGKTKRGAAIYQLVEDIDEDDSILGTVKNRQIKGISAQIKAFRKHGRDTPFTLRAY